MGLFSLKTKPDSNNNTERFLKSASQTVWEENCEELLNRYVDNKDWERSLKQHLQNLYPNNYQQMANNILTLNIVKKIVDRKAKLYRKAPERTLVSKADSSTETDGFCQQVKTDLIKQCRLNQSMKYLMQYYELFNSAILWGQADFATKQPYLTVLAPHNIIVDADPDVPDSLARARAIFIPLHHSENEGMGYVKYSRYLSEGRYHVKVEKLDANFNIEPLQPEEFDLYSTLEEYPFVLIKKDCLMGDMFPDIPHGLLRAARWLDHELCRGALNSRQSDFPAYTYNGTANELGPVNPITGAGTIICLGDEDKEITKLQVDTREQERNQNILFYLKLLAQACDIAPSTFTFDTDLLSGTAKFHDKQPEIEYREDLIEKVRPLEEQEIWPMLLSLATVASFKNCETLTGYNLSVVFPEAMIPLSEEERLKNLKMEIDMGLTSAAEIISRREDLPIDQANEKVSQHLQQTGV